MGPGTEEMEILKETRSENMKLKMGMLTFESDKKIKENISCVRGYFATRFIDRACLHNHDTDKFLYRYPQVQYKFLEDKPYLVGINEGVDVLREIFDEFETVTLNGNRYEITERHMSIKKQAFGLSPVINYYEFVTPWIALNSKNYDRYRGAQDDEQRVAYLRRYLIGNLLSMSKSMGYMVPGEIKCDVDLVKVNSEYKGKSFVSFKGRFLVNFEIPDYLGIGKAVSKGYGTVRKANLYF